ncbi:MAG: ABC transporter ATP-binding protein [Phycisphaerae bacterium]
MISLQNVSHHYGVAPVLRNVSLDIPSGELLTVMGPNGMGKSTLLQIAAGIVHPATGAAVIDGMTRRSSEEAELEIRQRVCYLPDRSWLPGRMTVREYCIEVGRLYAVPFDALFDHVSQLLQLFSLERKSEAALATLSQGQRKKAALCAMLATEAPILVLDEPFSGGLDPAGIFALRHVLRRLADREDVTILMATPVPELVEAVSHRVAIMRDGEIIAHDTIAVLRSRGGGESLEKSLDAIVHTETNEAVQTYFAAREAA